MSPSLAVRLHDVRSSGEVVVPRFLWVPVHTVVAGLPDRIWHAHVVASVLSRRVFDQSHGDGSLLVPVTRRAGGVRDTESVGREGGPLRRSSRRECPQGTLLSTFDWR
jgi:hypothetical protein